jgi:hypothetical protein
MYKRTQFKNNIFTITYDMETAYDNLPKNEDQKTKPFKTNSNPIDTQKCRCGFQFGFNFAQNKLAGFVRPSRIPSWVRDLLKIAAGGIPKYAFYRNEAKLDRTASKKQNEPKIGVICDPPAAQRFLH